VTYARCLSPKGRRLRYDFYVQSERLLVEANGLQHFDAKDPWYSSYYAECYEIKRTYAEQNGCVFVEIPYTRRATKHYVASLLCRAIEAANTEPSLRGNASEGVETEARGYNA